MGSSQDVRQQAKTAPGTGNPDLTVCPEQSPGCDFVGFAGIRQAIDSAPTTGLTTINIKNGYYKAMGQTCDNFSINIGDKAVYLKGEGDVGIDFNKTEVPQGCRVDGFRVTEVGGLIISNMGIYNSTASCFSFGNDTRGRISNIVITNCSDNGVYVHDNSNVSILDSSLYENGRQGLVLHGSSSTTVARSSVYDNEQYGIALVDQSSLTIGQSSAYSNGLSGVRAGNQSSLTITQSSVYENELNGVFADGQAQITAINNTFFHNRVVGINIYSEGDHNPSVTLVNNIFTHTRKNTDGTYGFGIGGAYAGVPENMANDDIHHNLVWANEGQNTGCGRHEICDFPNKVEADPLYVGMANFDFRLLPTSPAIGVADPAFLARSGMTCNVLGAFCPTATPAVTEQKIDAPVVAPQEVMQAPPSVIETQKDSMRQDAAFDQEMMSEDNNTVEIREARE